MSSQDTPLTVAYVHQLRAINAELLEALEGMMSKHGFDPKCSACKMARAAIAKAKGETCLPPLHVPGCKHRGETA